MLLALVSTAHAQIAQPTLEKIQAANRIAVGYREESLPFSYRDANGKVIGFSQDICNRIIAVVKARTQRPNLEVRFIPVTSQNRIPLVQNGTVDLECGVTTHLRARQSQVTFSNTFFVAGTRLLTRKDSGIHDFGDLVGKSVLTNQGTNSERILRTMNLHRQMDMRVISARDYVEGREVLESGRVAAYMMDDVLLAGVRSLTTHPSDWVIVGTPQSREAYAFMMRNGDPAFRQLVNDTMSALMKSGEMAALYRKWFDEPVPPHGVTIDFPMTAQLRALYAAPDDRALD
ncbi:glutamate/aspartate transport system substrate-binding protein [Paraburkholderia bannensis]|uniref:Glutamate/aspartate transport system substrate-binding protein n=1 Tax=Paraburkholderia bannensis TaxID=765414 RepID=A0A7W9TWS6_9BURK|nr:MULTISPECIES: transporter substrate-binding domain-containing protein [Paraburkholderia]MBB3257536.1 glutamate/aspartate transport system substrate-binding protein [Paraburkholderia sp. WP4_3_2]MBB6102549.1 glutamate/aspartate transport system substrate-binding protein [Paraburkholderia bannensis]